MRLAIFMFGAVFLLLDDLTARASDDLDPMISPEAAVHIQLRAMLNNDVPSPDSGIRKVWAFAHPENKRLTGPLQRFTAMIKGPDYAMLLNHRHHNIQLLERNSSVAVFAVRVTSAKGSVYVCQWQVAPVIGGENDGAWLTVSVSPLMPVGKRI